MNDIFNTNGTYLNEDHFFVGLVFKKNKENIWNQYKGWDYFNGLIQKGGNEEFFIEKMREMILEITHIYLSYSTLFKYLTYTMLGLSLLSILSGNIIFTLPILALLFYILKIFFFRKAIREYHTLYQEFYANMMHFVYRDKTIIQLDLKDKIKKAIFFVLIW
jgi:hypothetical protein